MGISKKNILIILGLILIILSCKNNEVRLVKKGVSTEEIKNENELNYRDILFFEFPDTTILGKLTEGKMKYNKAINGTDTIEERYIFFQLITDKIPQDIPLKEMRKKPNRFVYEDTIGEGDFTFNALFFKTGTNILHGVVEDIMVINNDDLHEGKIKTITKETIVTKQIYVKDTLN